VAKSQKRRRNYPVVAKTYDEGCGRNPADVAKSYNCRGNPAIGALETQVEKVEWRKRRKRRKRRRWAGGGPC
jgi:hypothetical protein